jgi:hypothetical protein
VTFGDESSFQSPCNNAGVEGYRDRVLFFGGCVPVDNRGPFFRDLQQTVSKLSYRNSVLEW